MWNNALPDIQPFYAVKCNDQAMLLKILASMGTGFDCSSKVRNSAVYVLYSQSNYGGLSHMGTVFYIIGTVRFTATLPVDTLGNVHFV